MEYEIRGYCGGFKIFSETVSAEDLEETFTEKKKALMDEQLFMRYGSGYLHFATELCIDVYDTSTGKCLRNLGTSFKNPKYADMIG